MVNFSYRFSKKQETGFISLIWNIKKKPSPMLDADAPSEKPRKQNSKPEKLRKPKIKNPSLSKIYSWRMALIVGETLAVMLFVVLLGAGITVWRLKSGPVDISFARDYVESALRDEGSGIYGTMESATLYWPDLQGPLLLGLQDGRIFGAQGREIIFVDELALSLSKSKLLIGKIEPLSLIITRPSLRVIRSENNEFNFGLGTEETVITEKIESQADDQKNLIERILDLIENPDSAEAKSSSLGSLRTLQVVDAQVMVEDHVFGASWFFPGLDIVFEKANRGIKSTLDFDLPEVDGALSHVKAELTLDRDNELFGAHLNLHNMDMRIFAGKVEALERLRGQNIVLSADVNAVFGPNLGLRSLVGTVSSEQGEILDAALSEEAIPYKDMKFDVAYQKAPEEKLSLSDLTLTLKDVTIRGGANIDGLIDAETGVKSYKGPMELTIDDMPHSAIEPLWPAFLRGDSSEEWIVKNMSGGDLSGLSAEATLVATQSEDDGWSVDAEKLLANFAVSNMNVDYRSPLPPVTKGSGKGVFDLDSDTISIQIDKAELGGLAVSKADLLFEKVVAKGEGSLKMDLALSGPLKSVFEYISLEPIDLKDELGMDVSKVKGEADLKVKLAFPTKSDLDIEEIEMDVSGKVTNGYLPDVLRGLPLSGGPFTVSVNNERYTVKGSGQLSERAVNVDWMEYLDSKGKPFKHQAKARITIDAGLRDHFGVDLKDFVEGSLPAEVVYTGYADKKADAQVDIDMKPARFFVEAFDFEKPVGTPGKTSLKAHLINNELKSITGLNVTAQGFDLGNATVSFRGAGKDTAVAQVKAGRFIIGETNSSGTIDFAPDGSRKIIMSGAVLDARPFMDDDENKDKPYTDPPTVFSINVKNMRTTDDDVVKNVKLYADIDGKGRYNQLEMDGVAGSGQIYLRYKPNAKGVRTFRLEADDAGAFLAAFDVYNNIEGGKLVIYGEPIRGVYERNLLGLAEITNFKVVEAPTLARLLGALSLPGVLQLLDNEGLSFTKLEAKFDWLYRPGGALMVLKEGRTSGNSLGFTFDGVFDNAAQKVDVSGTIIPLSGINKVIGSIPLVGDILTGGTGALFAATYSMKGHTDNPEISVNPLSVLTPGILRRILFE